MTPHLLSPDQISAALDAIAENIGHADDEFYKTVHFDDEWAEHAVIWYLELAYLQLLTLAETLGLPEFRALAAADLELARADGLGKTESDPEGDPHLKWAAPARRSVRALQGLFGLGGSRAITKDVESILRGTTYSLTDPKVFSGPPQNENDVHLRIEAILRCVFPDLRHKPSVPKPIKNFQPDTGLPSIHTLIEYKFLSSAAAAAQIADELLADTRGYSSPQWTSFIYVVYETQRFRSEVQWRQLMRESGVGADTIVIVLTGEAPSHTATTAYDPEH